MSDKTLCCDCVHWKITDKRTSDIWYFNVCTAEAVRLVADVDAVTGAHGFRQENSLGMQYICDSPYPYCRDINTGKECPHFSENEPSWVAKIFNK